MDPAVRRDFVDLVRVLLPGVALQGLAYVGSRAGIVPRSLAVAFAIVGLVGFLLAILAVILRPLGQRPLGRPFDDADQ